MPTRAATSFSADAISSACARLSSWQGPAINVNGKALPNLAEPALTIGFGSIMTRRTMQRGFDPVNHRSTRRLFKHERGTHRFCGRHNDPAHVMRMAHMAGFQARLSGLKIGH